MTKQVLADFYWAVAERMLPHIVNRPLSLVRCPEGSGRPCFFQKHVNHMLPKGMGSVDVPNKKTGELEEPYITLPDSEHSREALAGLAQMGVLEVHPWGSRNEDLERPDRLIFDLDPDESLGWATVTEAAAEVRKRLKRSGSREPAEDDGRQGAACRGADCAGDDVAGGEQFAYEFVRSMERANPALYLTKMTKVGAGGEDLPGLPAE